MIRDMMVAFRETTYNIDSHTFSTKLQIINGLVGPKADLEILKAEVEKIVSGFSFKSVWRTEEIDEE
jgi:hypothetical protein